MIANHPTLIDVVVLIGLMEQANCVVKQALWSNPFTKGPVQSAGYILNAGSEQFIQGLCTQITAGSCRRPCRSFLKEHGQQKVSS